MKNKLLEIHCRTSDLTINSIACDINGNIYDFTDGIKDLEKGIIKFVGEPNQRIKEDPLRVLRAIRFGAKYGFDIDSDSYTAIMNSKELVMDLPKERIRDEFLKILKYDGAYKALYDTDYMFWIVPKLQELCNIPGGSHHNETPFEHVWNAFNIAKTVSGDWRVWLAALLHDIGKGEAFEEIDLPLLEKKVTFHRHEHYGAEYVEKWMTEYKFSTADIKFVTTLVKMHMWGYKEEFNKKTFTKKVQQLKDAGISVYQFLMVCYCDHQGNMAKPRIKFGDFCHSSYFLKNYEVAIKENKPFKIPDLDIDGRLLMDMGFKGPEIGKTLNHLFDVVCEGKIENKRDQLIIEVKKNE